MRTQLTFWKACVYAGEMLKLEQEASTKKIRKKGKAIKYFYSTSLPQSKMAKWGGEGHSQMPAASLPPLPMSELGKAMSRQLCSQGPALSPAALAPVAGTADTWLNVAKFIFPFTLHQSQFSYPQENGYPSCSGCTEFSGFLGLCSVFIEYIAMKVHCLILKTHYFSA